METYLRLLKFSKPYKKFIPEYILYIIPATVFGALNFTLLIPLFNVLFGTSPLQINAVPEFQFSATYFKALFEYFFTTIVIEYGKMNAMFIICGIIFVSIFLSNLFMYLSQYVLTRMRMRLIYNLKKSLFEKLSTLHLNFFNHQKKGNLLSIMSSDVAQIEESIVNSIQVIFRDPLIIIVYIFILLAMSWKLTLITMFFFPAVGLLIARISKNLRNDSNLGQTLLGHVLSITDEAISGTRIIKAFNAHKHVQDRFDIENERYRKTIRRYSNRRELASPLSQVLGVWVILGIMIYGSSLVLSNKSELSAAQFITYIIIYSQILPPLKNISNAVSALQRAISSGARVLSIIDTKDEIINKDNAKELEDFKDKIVFDKLSFSYNGTDEVLKDINIVVPKGKMVALVGQSGSGKSTCADLLCRFYDPQKGSIRIDGIDIRDYSIESLRGQMGIVTQEAILFNDTIFNNIAFGMKNAKEEDVIRAAKVANAHDFIMATENGYQTNIGDRGLRLSGGQRQRISIARALLKNPSILILDEATSALDTESEKLVQEAIQKLMENRTSLVIAHRLSTIQYADEIIVMEKGEIVERGTHKELYHNSGIYRKLCDMQSFA